MKSYLRYIFSLILRQKKSFSWLIFLVFIGMVVRLAQPYLYKVVVDTLTDGLAGNYFSDAAVQLMVVVIAVWFVLSVLGNLIHSQSDYLGWQIGSRSAQWVSIEGYKKLLKLDYHKHTTKHSSTYAKLIDDADVSTWEMSNWWLNRIIPAMVGFTGMLIIALSVSWQMTLLSLAVVPPGLAMIIFMIKKYEDEQHLVNKLWRKKHEHMSDQLANIITYKLNEDEKLFVKDQLGYSQRATDAQTFMNKKWRKTTMLNPDVIARFLVMGVGVFFVKDGLITIGTLFMFMGLLNEILIPLHLLGDILPQFSRRARHIEKYLDLLKEENEVVDPSRAVKIKDIKGKIEFRNVDFNYSGKAKSNFSLKNISFTIEPGQQVAFVGHSGAGKSTIAGLVTRLMDVNAGQILIDDTDLRKYKRGDLMRYIGTVLQENSLYNETIAENIAYGNPRATRKEIITAAKMAQAHDFIKKLQDGYDTRIGERGVRLSGGEKQRLAIARAILKRPRIVVLDEPTSALDSVTESKVQKGLMKLIEGRTSITIAHRLSTVRNADKIVIIEKGKVIAMGSHMELLRSCNEYRDMVDLQTGGFLAE